MHLEMINNHVNKVDKKETNKNVVNHHIKI